MEHLYEYLIGGKKLGSNSKYKYFPKTKDELKDAINTEIEIQGLEADLNCINTSKITDMSWIFGGSKFNGNISDWDTGNVVDMSYTFECSNFNGDISKWDVSNVTNMCNMFFHSKFNGDISKWDVNNVKDMERMFQRSPLENNPPKWYKE